MLKFNHLLLGRSARTPSETETNCAIRTELDLGEEPVPRKTRYSLIENISNFRVYLNVLT